MENLEFIAGTLVWAGKNTAYNLDFIPDDKLSWKPSPDANSALEIAQHVVMALTMLRAGIVGETGEVAPAPVPASRDEAKQQIVGAAEACAVTIRNLTPEDFNRTVSFPNGVEFPMQRAVGVPLIDLVHHHGQVAYLQTILGDKESHFDPSGF